MITKETHIHVLASWVCEERYLPHKHTPEFHPQAPQSCSLTATCKPWHTCPSAPPNHNTHIHQIIIILKERAGELAQQIKAYQVIHGAWWPKVCLLGPPWCKERPHMLSCPLGSQVTAYKSALWHLHGPPEIKKKETKTYSGFVWFFFLIPLKNDS